MANPRRRYLLIPFLYVGVILLLLALALFARGFSHSIGDARLAGRYAPLPLFGSRETSSVTLSYHGLSLRFSRRFPLLIGASGQSAGSSRPRGLLAVERYAAGADILFEGDIRLRLAAPDGSAADGSVSLSLLMPPEAGEPIQLEIPFRLRGAFRPTENAPMLSWERGGSGFLLTLPAGSRIDSARGSIALGAQATTGSRELRFSRAAGATQSPNTAWLSEEASRVGPEELKQVLTRYSDAAYRGWSETRLVAGETLWKMPDGKTAFDERIGDGLLAESVPRGTYQRLRAVYAEALAGKLRGGSGPSIRLSASAYIGNLREYTRRLSASEPAEIERIRGLLARSDAALLQTPGLVPYILNHGPFSLVPEVYAFAESRDVPGLGLPESLGLLETLLDHLAFVEKTEAGSRKCRETIERKLLPSMKKTDGGIFFEAGLPGRIDIGQSVRCGSLLMRAGALMDMPLAASVGRALLASSLELADDMGFLPGSVGLTATHLTSREGTLAPEEIYALLPLDIPLPRETPLYRELGPGCWIWTAARLSRSEGTSAGTTISLAFPVGLPHYVAVQGIKPFSELKLHGIPWRPAPDYAQYSDGWFYDAQTDTLYLKLTHRVETEEILIAY
jgi:hypothetical protein